MDETGRTELQTAHEDRIFVPYAAVTLVGHVVFESQRLEDGLKYLLLFWDEEWVWGPYGTRVCNLCERLAADDQVAEIVEEAAARNTVYGGFRRFSVDPEEWRDRELGKIHRWLEVRTDRRAV